jgi:hypothetical protein
VKTIFAGLFAALLLSPAGGVWAQQKPSSSQEKFETPAGSEEFFKSLGDLFARYPDAAKRFAILDKMTSPLVSTPGDKMSPFKARLNCSGHCQCGYWCWETPFELSCCSGWSTALE